MKCLGAQLDDCVTWKKHIDSVRKKCFYVLAKIRSLQIVLPSSIKIKLYNALVLLHFNYCSVVWQECAKNPQQHVEQILN